MELNITWNNGLHDAKQFWNFVRRLSYMNLSTQELAVPHNFGVLQPPRYGACSKGASTRSQ